MAVGSLVLASVGSLFDARITLRYVTSAARLDLATATDALDLVDVGDGGAVTTSVGGILNTLRSNAATARVERSEGVDALAASRTIENRAELHTNTVALRNGAENGHGTLRRLRAAGRGASGGRLAVGARSAVVAVRVGVLGALAAGLAVLAGDLAGRAGSAGLGAGVGDGAGRAVGAHVVVRVLAGRALGAASVLVDLAVGALVDALVGGGRATAASLSGRALSARAGSGRRVGVLRAV